eukprot:3579863-Pleurochrysis_carterae.AAC.3
MTIKYKRLNRQGAFFRSTNIDTQRITPQNTTDNLRLVEAHAGTDSRHSKIAQQLSRAVVNTSALV